MYKVVIIGAGQLGSRHLQALLKTQLQISIEVVDPIEKSLEIAKDRAGEIPPNMNIKSISYFSSIDAISNDIDFCLIATTANVRFEVLKNLLLKANVKYLVLEKILFQKIEEYSIVADILKSKNIKCWVNCPRRSYPVYQQIKSLITPDEQLTYTVVGGDWSLASNAIHFIDVLNFLNENTEFKFEKFSITDVVESKRPGNFELMGTLIGKQSNGSNIFLTSRKDSQAGLITQIFSRNFLWQIDESKGELRTYSTDNQWKVESTTFSVPFQSELTNLVCEDILNNGKCDLPSFEISGFLHRAMLTTFQEIFAEKLGVTDLCPIT